MIDMTEAYAYLQALRDCGRKENTLHNYEKILSRIIELLAEDGRPTKAAEITKDDILYLYRNLPTKEEVTRSYLRTLAGMIIHYTGVDVVKQTNLLFNRPMYNRRFLSDEEFRALYMAADPIERMTLILGGMMGLRRAEIASVRDEDIRNGMLTVHGKGHTEQGLVFKLEIPTMVSKEIDAYRSWKHQFAPGNDGYLIQTPNIRNGGRLTRTNGSNLGERLRLLGKRVGIQVSPHELRRYYATTLYRQGVDLETLKDLMRHSDVSTTLRCYVQPSDERQRQAVKTMDQYMASVLV